MIKDPGGTIIFFPSGKFRVMGCINDVDAVFLAIIYVEKIDASINPELELQSYTCRAKLPYAINMYKLSQCEQTFYEPELFCSIRMTKYKPLSVNVFSTGSIVVCGLKDPDYMHIIISDIDNLCKNL